MTQLPLPPSTMGVKGGGTATLLRRGGTSLWQCLHPLKRYFYLCAFVCVFVYFPAIFFLFFSFSFLLNLCGMSHKFGQSPAVGTPNKCLKDHTILCRSRSATRRLCCWPSVFAQCRALGLRAAHIACGHTRNSAEARLRVRDQSGSLQLCGFVGQAPFASAVANDGAGIFYAKVINGCQWWEWHFWGGHWREKKEGEKCRKDPWIQNIPYRYDLQGTV